MVAATDDPFDPLVVDLDVVGRDGGLDGRSEDCRTDDSTRFCCEDLELGGGALFLFEIESVMSERGGDLLGLVLTTTSGSCSSLCGDARGESEGGSGVGRVGYGTGLLYVAHLNEGCFSSVRSMWV